MKRSEEQPANLEGRAAEEEILPKNYEQGVSLEELQQSYAKVLGQDIRVADSAVLPADTESATQQDGSSDPSIDQAAEFAQVNPLSILEAILFVGNPDGSSISAKEIAGLIRGVLEKEVSGLVEELNQQLAESESALCVAEHADGFRMQLRSELEPVRERFYERSRPVVLNQAAVDCLALIAYQPGVSRDRIEEQRGQPCGGVLNQLVRRRLVGIRRSESKAEGGRKRRITCYYPTERLMELVGLGSLDDLPQVEELDLE